MSAHIRKIRSGLRNIQTSWRYGSYMDETEDKKKETLLQIYRSAEDVQQEAFNLKALIAEWANIDVEAGLKKKAERKLRIPQHETECEEYALSTESGKRIDNDFNSEVITDDMYYDRLDSLIGAIHANDECPVRHHATLDKK
jgi:hypothetical protein